MANKEEFRKTLLQMFKARIPFISIKSIERARVMEVISMLSEEMKIPIYSHSLSHGMKDIKTNKPVSEDRSISGGLDFVVQQISQRQNLTFVFTEISELEEDNPVSRLVYDCVIQAIDRGACICVISMKSIWPQLQRMGMTITLEPPDEEEMYEIVKQVVTPYSGSIPIEWNEPEMKMASSILANMTHIEAENVLSTLMAKGSLKKEDLGELTNAKDKLFNDISGLEKVKIDTASTSMAGLSGLQQWLSKQQRLLTIDLKRRKLRPPRGVLLVGVPGCGKSLSAKFIAASWNLPLYRLDLASIHGQYLGQSENRLREALASADHAAPCILWIDEIEKGLSGATGSADGGTTTRMVGQFLFWLQENSAKVFVVATANNVSQLPPELLRKGRFDELFFVDLPGAEERKEIIELYIRRNLVNQPSVATMEKLVEISDGFAGSDIEAAVREVAIHAEFHGDDAINDDFFERSFRNIVPLSKTSPEQIENIRMWGRERAVTASGVSWDSQASDKVLPKRSILI